MAFASALATSGAQSVVRQNRAGGGGSGGGVSGVLNPRVECTVPGCSQVTWNGEPNQQCCRTCLESNGSQHGPTCDQKAAGGGVQVPTVLKKKPPQVVLDNIERIRRSMRLALCITVAQTQQKTKTHTHTHTQTYSCARMLTPTHISPAGHVE